ncbi:MAG: hypothetical protein EUB_01986 [Eubacterium sp.]|uniref:hypothetical protein n=1 Tax=Eubacterium sp. TaxID=142586 RepID=UPI00305EEC21
MDVKISKSIFFKVIALLLCIYIGITPFFQPKKVQADTLGKIKAYSHIITTVLYGLRTVGFISDTTLTPENLENIYNKADEYLHQNFGTELEYAEALRQVDQLGLDIASGQIFVPGNYSGKLWYSFLNAVKDVLYPTQEESVVTDNEYFFSYYYDGYITWKPGRNWIVSKKPSWPYRCVGTNYATGQSFDSLCIGQKKDHHPMSGCVDAQLFFYSHSAGKKSLYFQSDTYYFKDEIMPIYRSLDGMDPYCKNVLLGGNGYLVPNITAKTANKVKLPTRLPQTVINNINNYIDGSSENLIVNPTPDELPALPDNYNPATDDLINLPGYEDVTPDQQPSTDPEPTPTPEPTPEPTPTPPDYDGSSWIKPIGDFFAGLLSFLKDALIPTQTVDFSPLQNMVRMSPASSRSPCPVILENSSACSTPSPSAPILKWTSIYQKSGFPASPSTGT